MNFSSMKTRTLQPQLHCSHSDASESDSASTPGFSIFTSLVGSAIPLLEMSTSSIFRFLISVCSSSKLPGSELLWIFLFFYSSISFWKGPTSFWPKPCSKVNNGMKACLGSPVDRRVKLGKKQVSISMIDHHSITRTRILVLSSSWPAFADMYVRFLGLEITWGNRRVFGTSNLTQVARTVSLHRYPSRIFKQSYSKSSVVLQWQFPPSANHFEAYLSAARQKIARFQLGFQEGHGLAMDRLRCLA